METHLLSEFWRRETGFLFPSNPLKQQAAAVIKNQKSLTFWVVVDMNVSEWSSLTICSHTALLFLCETLRRNQMETGSL